MNTVNTFLLAVSKDEGRTWHHPEGESVEGGGLLLPDGDLIQIYTPKAIKVEDLQLPDSISSSIENYGRTFVYYKLNELPEKLQGVYLKRMTNGTNSWTIEHAVLNDPDAVRYTDSGLFPVVWWGDMTLLADGSVIAGIYPGFCLNEDDKVDPSGILFYRFRRQQCSTGWRLYALANQTHQPGETSQRHLGDLGSITSRHLPLPVSGGWAMD